MATIPSYVNDFINNKKASKMDWSCIKHVGIGGDSFSLEKEIEFNDASILIPKEYRFKDSDKKAYGFIAQEVEKTGYTDIVNTDEETGDKTLDYNSAFAIAISQMQAKIKQLEDEIKELKNK